MIGVLVSGEGTNLQALIDAGLPISAVASNKAEAYALERARAAGIPAAVFELGDYESREARDAAMGVVSRGRQNNFRIKAVLQHPLTWEALLDRIEATMRRLRDGGCIVRGDRSARALPQGIKARATHHDKH